MPNVVIWMLGAVGAAAAAKWLLREYRRINSELHPPAADPACNGGTGEGAATLRRGPSGIYRPV